MAIKKDSEIENVVEEKVEKKKTPDPWKQMVTVRVDKAHDGSPNYETASVNGRVFKIKRGVNVEVPAPIAEVLQHSLEAREEADTYIESKTE